MKTLVVVGHPSLEKSVVNKAWVESLRPHEGEQLKIHILENSILANGKFDLSKEQALIEEYDRIVLQFPLYWYMPPAIMKLWMDTVWAEGWAWGEGGIHMKGKLIDVATSCGAPAVAFSSVSLSDYLSCITGSAAFVQAISGECFAFYDAESVGYEARLEENCKEYVGFIIK